MGYELEVCVDSLASIKAAAGGGADRVELCSVLELGGLSPSLGLLKLSKASFPKLIVCAMVRPRAGDFCYSHEEFETMLAEVALLKAHHCDGIVTGILRPDGCIDIERMLQIMTVATPMTVVFHRAIDVAKDPIEGLEQLVAKGLKRVLTSGRALKVTEGLSEVRALVDHFGDRLEVMVGSGVNANNIESIISETGCNHVHLSGRTPFPSQMDLEYRTGAMEAFENIDIYRTDEAAIAQIRSQLNQLCGG